LRNTFFDWAGLVRAGSLVFRRSIRFHLDFAWFDCFAASSFRTNLEDTCPSSVFLGAGGPLVAALLSAYLFYGQVGVVDLLSGALNWRVGLVWYVLTIAPIGIVYLTSAVLYGLWQRKRVVLFKKPSRAVLMLILPQVWVVVAEEFGWRGFARFLIFKDFSDG